MAYAQVSDGNNNSRADEEEFYNVSLRAIGYSCKQMISFMLNKNVQLREGMTHVPNYGGLGELIGLTNLEVEEASRRENPGLAILEFWKERLDLYPTVRNLLQYLNQLQRQDIIESTLPQISTDVEKFRNQVQPPVQINSVSSSRQFMDRELTIHDCFGGTAIFDAFICYDEADSDFVLGMVDKLEQPKYGFRFFLPNRDGRTGFYNEDILSRIISERCRHMIVVISRNFITSDACRFQSSYGFALNPSARDKKLIPIKIEDCQMPGIFKIVSACEFYNGNRDWTWRRLVYSLMGEMPHSEFVGPKRFLPNAQSELLNLIRGGAGVQGIGTSRGSAPSPPTTSSSSSSSSTLSVAYDSGFNSLNLNHGAARIQGRENVTAPVTSNSSSAPSTSSGPRARIVTAQTAPVMSSNNQPIKREKSPSLFGIFKQKK